MVLRSLLQLAGRLGLAGLQQPTHWAHHSNATHPSHAPPYPRPPRQSLPPRPQATTLRLLGSLHTSLGALLAEDAAQHLKSCDTDVRGCGQANPVTHVLQAVPRVFTLQVGSRSADLV